MGNPDFVVVINDCAYLIRGRKLGYDTNGDLQQRAIEEALGLWNGNLARLEADMKAHPDMADPDYDLPSVESIKVYTVEGEL